MIDMKYANAYSEVLEILKYIPSEDYKKIPKNIIELYETNANTNYTFIYNPAKTLSEQNVSKIAKGIIAILFRDYWATEIQREKIITKQNYDRQRLEKEKKEKYNSNIFQCKSNHNEIIEESNLEIVICNNKNKESIFKKIIYKIKNIFCK